MSQALQLLERAFQLARLEREALRTRNYDQAVKLSEQRQALMEAAQLVFLRLSEELDEDGEQYLESIQDEEEFDRVAEIFRDKLSEEYEFLEDDGEE